MSLLLQKAFCAPLYQQGIALVFLPRTLKDNPSYGVKSQRTICKNITYTYAGEEKYVSIVSVNVFTFARVQ